MKHALAAAQREVLERFAGSRMLLALDYDGTLAPIDDDPDRAAMLLSTRRLLRRVARVYPCAVISGRARSDVLRRVAGVGVLEVVGNHGSEPGEATAPAVSHTRGWVPLLQHGLGPLAGVTIEDKGLSLAVHYRHSREKAATRARIAAVAAGLPGARLVGGKQVLNVLPLGAPHKGLALERIVARLDLDAAVYVGDDDTDEDAFAFGRTGGVLGIRVCPRAGSSAGFYIRKQAEIDALLRLLLELRRGTRKDGLEGLP